MALATAARGSCGIDSTQGSDSTAPPSTAGHVVHRTAPSRAWAFSVHTATMVAAAQRESLEHNAPQRSPTLGRPGMVQRTAMELVARPVEHRLEQWKQLERSMGLDLSRSNAKQPRQNRTGSKNKSAARRFTNSFLCKKANDNTAK